MSPCRSDADLDDTGTILYGIGTNQLESYKLAKDD
jgi:hypothetical protein